MWELAGSRCEEAPGPPPKEPTIQRELPTSAFVRLGTTLALTGLLTVTACSGADDAGQELGLDEPLPTDIPEGTVLSIGDPKTQRALELSGEVDDLPFEPEWANMDGGPQTSEAFRAEALDVGAVADIPPLHARWTNLDVRVITASEREDPLDFPLYEIGIAPGADVESLEDIGGLRVAYSPGQAQGAIVLRLLESVGLSQDDVELVEITSVDDSYVNALASDEVDVAPLSGVLIRRYLERYEEDGAAVFPHELRDDPWHLYAPEEVLQDPAKAAALRALAQAWGRASEWISDNPEEWADGFYVDHEGLSPEDAAYLVERDGQNVIPESWDDTIERHQATADLLAAEQDWPEVDVREEVYDTRFEPAALAEAESGGDA
ncbi:ABC transporter substrate-binding protein [Nocardiopsis oceani]